MLEPVDADDPALVMMIARGIVEESFMHQREFGAGGNSVPDKLQIVIERFARGELAIGCQHRWSGLRNEKLEYNFEQVPFAYIMSVAESSSLGRHCDERTCVTDAVRRGEETSAQRAFFELSQPFIVRPLA